jgi:hypothetical protein
MTQPNVPEKHWADALADELHRIAGDVRRLNGSTHGMPRSFQINIQPGGVDAADGEVVAAHDEIARALLGVPGSPKAMGDGSTHYNAAGRRGPISVAIYRSIDGAFARGLMQSREAAAVLAAKEAELERLRAEVAKLRGAHSEPGAVKHFQFIAGDTACMLDRLPEGATATTDAGAVTCSGCRKSLKLDEPAREAARELLAIAPTGDGGAVFAMSGPAPVVHHLGPDSDGDPGDSVACGLRLGNILSYSGSLDRVTCGMCRAVAEPVSETR